MLNFGKKNRALSEKKILNETKNHNPPPLQVKLSVPNISSVCFNWKAKKMIVI